MDKIRAIGSVTMELLRPLSQKQNRCSKVDYNIGIIVLTLKSTAYKNPNSKDNLV